MVFVADFVREFVNQARSTGHLSGYDARHPDYVTLRLRDRITYAESEKRVTRKEIREAWDWVGLVMYLVRSMEVDLYQYRKAKKIMAAKQQATGGRKITNPAQVVDFHDFEVFKDQTIEQIEALKKRQTTEADRINERFRDIDKQVSRLAHRDQRHHHAMFGTEFDSEETRWPVHRLSNLEDEIEALKDRNRSEISDRYAATVWLVVLSLCMVALGAMVVLS